MTPSEIEAMKNKLWIGEQTYNLKKDENLDKLADRFGYISRAILIDANKDLIEKRGGTTSLWAGDTIILPRLTSLNDAKSVQAARKQQVEDELKIAEGVQQGAPIFSQYKLPATMFSTPASPPPSWECVRIYWGNNNPKDLTKTFPFPQIHAITGSTKSERTMGVETLKQKVHINQFETLHNNKAQSGQQQVEKSWEAAKFEAEDLDEAYQKSIEVQNEKLYVSSSQLEDFGDYIKFSHNDQSQKRGDDVLIEKKRVGRIASAVSQYVIVEVELTEPLEDGDKLPNVTTWAFLQPPAIGNNKYRKAAQNDWVVDDAQKSGWFLGEIRGSDTTLMAGLMHQFTIKMELNRTCYTVDKNNKEKKQQLKYTQDVIAEVTADRKKVRYKYEVIVYNDCSKEDYQKKRNALLDGQKYADVLSLECGSYMKVWARNSDFPWSDYGPVDEFTERLRLFMDREDPHINPRTKDGGVNPNYNPQLAPNHSWRRERLIDASAATDPNEKTYGDLLYVGLYPTSLISALNNIEEIAQPHQPGQPRTLNLPTWAAVSFIFGAVLYGVRSVIAVLADKKAEKMRSATQAKKSAYLKKVNKGLEGNDANTYSITPADLNKAEYWRHAYAEKAESLLKTLEVVEVFSLFAVGGFANDFDIEATLKSIMDEDGNVPVDKKAAQAYSTATKDVKEKSEDAVNIARMLEMTVTMYGHFIHFGIFDLNNKYTKKSHKKDLKDKRDDAKERLRERRTKGIWWRTLSRGETPSKKEVIAALKQVLQPNIEDEDEGYKIELATGDIPLVSYNDKKIMPHPVGKPLPGYLAFIFWSFVVKAKGDLSLNLATEWFKNKSNKYLNNNYEACDQASSVIAPEDELVKILLGVSGKDASVEVGFSLQAAWTAAVRAYDAGATTGHEKEIPKGLNDFSWGPALIDVFSYLEVSFDIGAKLTTNAAITWALTFFFNRKDQNAKSFTSQLQELSSNLKLNAPMSCRLAIFSWQYELASMNVAEVRTKEASFLSEVTFFNKLYTDMKRVVSWGEHKIAKMVYRHYKTSQYVYFGDEIGLILGFSGLGSEPRMTARIGAKNAILFTDHSDAANSETNDALIELKGDQFSYIEKTEAQLTYNDQGYRKAVVIDFELQQTTQLAITNFTFTFSLAAEKQFGGSVPPDASVVDISQHGIAMMSLLNQLDGGSELTLAAKITPGSQYSAVSLEQGDIVLKLPVVTEKRVKETATGLRFIFGIKNFKRKYEYVWLQVEDVDDASANDLIKFKARADQPEGFMAWNLVRLTREEAAHTAQGGEPFGHYYYDCPTSHFEKTSVEGAKDYFSDELEISPQLAYFANVKNSTYMDGGTKKVIQPDGNTYLLKESLVGNGYSKVSLNKLLG